MRWQPTLQIRGVRSPIDFGFLIGALALILVGWVAHRSARQLRNESSWVAHTYEVLRVVDQLHADALLPRTDADRIRMADEVRRLKPLVADNPRQQARVDSLNIALGTGAVGLGSLLDAVELEEQRLLAQRRAATDSTAQRATTIIVLSTVLAVLLMAGALALLHEDLRRRREAELALQASEAKHRLLMDQAADAIFIVSPEAITVEGNARAAEIVGRPRSELVGLPLKAFVRNTDAAAGPVLPMLRYGHVNTGEFWVTRPDGSRVAVEIRATMLEDGRIQVIARDISERKEVERVKDEFVSIVSHELRTPLTSIRGALGLLAAGRLDDAPDKRKRMLELATTNADRLIRLINDILDIERIKSGGITFDIADLSARVLVAHVIEAMRPLADHAGVVLRAEVEDVRVWADDDRMTQTLTNLIDNAIKFSPLDSYIDITVRREGRSALFEVRDHGRGIPIEMREAVFDRFRQVDNSDSREKGGSGLGLAICRSIVEQHGGRIWVESDLGRGSAFRFTVPMPIDGPVAARDATAPTILMVG